MKKASNKKSDPDMRNEYDFSKGVRGKYAQRYAEGSNAVVLPPDLAKAFPTAEAVHEALRGGLPFIDRQVFGQVIDEIPRRDGGVYQDVDTIYRDMSRLTVAWLANTAPTDIKRVYNELGWGGAANARALHECARHWMATHHPEMLGNAPT